MKRITNYALNCLIEQGISKEHIKSLIKAIENQTRDNILTPELATVIFIAVAHASLAKLVDAHFR